MKLKKNVIISNLNPQLQKKLPLLDVLHQEITGNPLVVTSCNDSKHWGSIKKKDRPIGWKNMTEYEVRVFSNSKHYTDDAFDFRRRCPYGKYVYYDEMTSSQRKQFHYGLTIIFPDKKFDVVMSSMCGHCEFDPQPIKLTDDDLKIKAKADYDKYCSGFYDEKGAIELPPLNLKVPFYKKDKFKRKLGAVVGAIGLICSIIPEPTVQVIGNIITTLGGGTLIAGAGHGMVKNRQKGEETKIDTIAILRWVADLLIRLFTKKGESK